MATELPGEAPTPDERTSLLDQLGYFRAVLLRKVENLDRDALAAPHPPSGMTLGGLAMHLALVERGWFGENFAGQGLPQVFAAMPWDDDIDWEWHNAHSFEPATIVGWLREAIDASDQIIAGAALDDLSAAADPSATPRNLRWVIMHMICEYARHCGHADLMREAIDGTTND